MFLLLINFVSNTTTTTILQRNIVIVSYICVELILLYCYCYNFELQFKKSCWQMICCQLNYHLEQKNIETKWILKDTIFTSTSTSTLTPKSLYRKLNQRNCLFKALLHCLFTKWFFWHCEYFTLAMKCCQRAFFLSILSGPKLYGVFSLLWQLLIKKCPVSVIRHFTVLTNKTRLIFNAL